MTASNDCRGSDTAAMPIVDIWIAPCTRSEPDRHQAGLFGTPEHADLPIDAIKLRVFSDGTLVSMDRPRKADRASSPREGSFPYSGKGWDGV